MLVKLNSLEKVEADIVKSIKLAQECGHEFTKAADHQRDMDATSDAKARKETVLTDLSNQEQQMQRQLAGARDKLERINKTNDTRREQVQDQLESTRKELQSIERSRHDVQLKIDACEQHIQKLKVQLAQEQEAHTNKMHELGAQFVRLGALRRERRFRRRRLHQG